MNNNSNVHLSLSRQVKERVAALLSEHRARKFHSVRAVAKKVKVRRSRLSKWESARSTPPSYKYFAIISFYGETARTAAMELDTQFLIERYKRYQTRTTG